MQRDLKLAEVYPKLINQNRKGFFVVIEGLDRCGKTTQSNMLNDALYNMWKNVYLTETQAPYKPELFKFPDRTTEIGHIINTYLQKANDYLMGFDEVIHLLFSANRWEMKNTIERCLSRDRIVIADRYTYSGVAYSVAKGLEYEWCKNCDVGLPEPDLVIFLDMKVEEIVDREGFGEERYEKKEFLEKVNNIYKKIIIENVEKFAIFDANQDVNHLHDKILRMVLEKIQK